jgi:hypothetical protein
MRFLQITNVSYIYVQNNATYADGKKFAFSGGYVWLQVGTDSDILK